MKKKWEDGGDDHDNGKDDDGHDDGNFDDGQH